jgi:acyl-CoA synthetase
VSQDDGFAALSCGAREVPSDLRRRYETAGWWDGSTLGSMLFDGFRRNGHVELRVWSRTRPYRGTFDDVRRLAMRVAGGLASLGVGPGDVVAFQLPNWVETAATFYALAALGAVPAPIVHTYNTKEVRFILGQVGARALVIPDAFGRRTYAAEMESLRSELPELDHIIVIGTQVPGSMIPFAELATAEPIPDIARVDPRSAAIIGYTSGTSADPKGVVHVHEAACAEVRCHMAQVLARGRPVLVASPISHITAMLIGLLVPSYRGEPVHLVDEWDPPFVLDAMQDGDLSAGTGAVVFISTLLDEPSITPEHITRIGSVALGGSPVSDAVVERCEAVGISVTRGYGCTEHPSISSASIDEPKEERNRYDGHLLAGVEVRVVDAEGRDVAPGQPGEILSRGPDLFVGYVDGRQTLPAFTEDGWFATGDIGILRDDGWIKITDRKKDIIIRGGENISAVEVEEALLTLPGIAETAVVAAPDRRMGEHAAAFVRLRTGATPPELRTVRAHLAAVGMAKLKWPEELHLVDDFPRTASGKIKKVHLRDDLRRQG